MNDRRLRAGLKPVRGFALLITVTLLAFMLILLLGLAAYTRVEIAVAGNTQRQAQAREHALFALNLALAQLQQYAGPDQRVTATAEAVANVTGTARYTGVWDSTTSGSAPMTWLVSGNERRGSDGAAQPLAITPSAPGEHLVTLLGRNSTGSAVRNADHVLAPLQPIAAPGATGEAMIGRYAWWVGDQGVKAPVAAPDTTTRLAYEPYDSSESRFRIRQQIGLGTAPADASGNLIFEPHDARNTSLVSDGGVIAASQLAWLNGVAGTPLGAVTVQQNLHTWSSNNFGVLANTKEGGLRQDLSVEPTLLGEAFARWSDYTAYTEDPASPVAPGPLPAYAADPLRRRVIMQPTTAAGGAVFHAAPVLTYFLLSFNIRTENGSAAVRPLQARARWMFTLWNPYTSAFVPENLRIDIDGLPESFRIVDEALGATVAMFSPGIFGTPLRIALPWNSSASTAPDHRSWLPGRVHTWTALADATGSVPAEGWNSRFDSRNLSADGGQGVQMPIAGVPLDGDALCRVVAPEAHAFTVRLYAVRDGGDVLLGTFRSPEFNAFATTPQKLSQGNYQFSYLFRLGESFDSPAAPGTWLETRDPRVANSQSESFLAVPNGPSPELYPSYTTISAPDRLLDRAGGNVSFDEDTPLFELPRAPVLSLGMLQHLALDNHRCFSIGNSWSAEAQLNNLPAAELFDRFFLSGLTAGVTPIVADGALILPNPQLRVISRNSTADRGVSVADLKAAPQARSSKFLLQGAAFNLNSVNPLAWAAVLRSVRFPAPRSFEYLNASFDTGTSGDARASLPTDAVQFLRFSQSAQETYRASEPTATSTYAASNVAAPAKPNPPSAANTHLFRRGLRPLSGSEVTALAQKIAHAIASHTTTHGPFRSLEEFLGPAAGSEPSLMEQAIADAGINADIAEFSSQFLTQADVMTALGPTLFARSDTFVIRAYGEAVNPATEVSEGRAWCEATVQRVPEYFDATQPEETIPADLNALNQHHGRRFKVISFRWLTRSDI